MIKESVEYKSKRGGIYKISDTDHGVFLMKKQAKRWVSVQSNYGYGQKIFKTIEHYHPDLKRK